MVGIIIALLIVFGAGGLAIGSDSAKPGDPLFGIDRALENIQISLAGDQEKDELRIRFAAERIDELNELLEEDEDSSSEEEDATEEDESDSEDENEITEEVAKDVRTGLEVALAILTTLRENSNPDDPRIEGLTTAINAIMEKLPEGFELEIEDDRVKIEINDEDTEEDEAEDEDEEKVEIKAEPGKIKVEFDGGALEIESDDDSSSAQRGLEEVEATVFSDITVIQVEYNDLKTTFNIPGNTREDIVAAILARFPNLTSTQVNSALKIEIKDENEDGDLDDDEDEDSDEDSDDDEEEDEADED